jgi:putative ABC transport system ATP-binding protein
VLEIRDLVKHHQLDRVAVRALDGVTMTVARGQFVALYGPSGSGKTTLLDLIVGLRSVPDSGSIRVDGRDVAAMSNKEADEYRLHKLGIIGEPGVLQPGASAVRAAAIRLAMDDARHAERRVAPLLVRLGLGGRLKHRVEQLSMGERQRVVIALALSTDPQLVLADEPTGHLDAENSSLVLTLLRELCRERGVALLLATHDREAAAFADEVHELRDGKLKPYAADSAPVLSDFLSRAGGSAP